MKRIILAIALLLTACAQTPTGEVVGEPIEIGVVSALTGKAATFGASVQNGVELALQEINDQDGIDGRPMVAAFEDEQCNPAVGVNAVRKLIDTNKVSAVVGPMCSSVTMATAPIFQEENVVMIAPVASAPKLTATGNYIFRTSVSTKHHSENLASFAIEKGQKGGILYINLENGAGYRDDFTESFEGLGGTIIGVETYDADDTDVRTQLTKLQEADVLFIASQLSLGTVLRQVRELGNEQTIIGISAMEDQKILEVARDAAEGVYYSYSAFDPEAPELADYQERFREMHGKESDWFAANAYDATMLIAEGLRRCGEESKCIRDYLFTVEDYPGMGGLTTFDEQGDVEKPLLIKVIRNGEFVVYEPDRP